MGNNSFDPELLVYLSQYVTDHKKARMEEVLALRSRFFTVVLEDIYKPHNASAVIRTCDCFGVQDIHIIERANSYDVNPYVTRGAAQWVDIHKYQDDPGRSSVDACFEELRAQGYKVMATSPHGESVPLHELKADQKTALVFGNEHAGVSEEVIQKSDGVVHIPMTGFTESFNISVSASICLYDLQQKIVRSRPEVYYLSESEKAEIRFRWYKSVVKNAEAHIRNFYGSESR
ncbi:TrmH family RNA methyltransferase [Echinicola strongylocentroti]|uniref:tRNA (guanosine(18)-2'-O)-methyltransferase n=1 Tax=Echinicola strongylocentroti TaxID=1795355 RepID=A0A2Z4IQA2_9BACT|nr:TrmH family RNA methyltransferase [Echinicola strongylocentroti]AWW32808.1 TrmH family RNA methyltransferase [Echinicola strongylocentroti]